MLSFTNSPVYQYHTTSLCKYSSRVEQPYAQRNLDIVAQDCTSVLEKNNYPENILLKKSNSLSNLARTMNVLHNEKNETVYSDVRHYTHCEQPANCTCHCVDRQKSYNESRRFPIICHSRNENYVNPCQIQSTEQNQLSSHFRSSGCRSLNRCEETKSSGYGPQASHNSLYCGGSECKSCTVKSISRRCTDSNYNSNSNADSCRIAIDGIKVIEQQIPPLNIFTLHLDK